MEFITVIMFSYHLRNKQNYHPTHHNIQQNTVVFSMPEQKTLQYLQIIAKLSQYIRHHYQQDLGYPHHQVDRYMFIILQKAALANHNQSSQDHHLSESINRKANSSLYDKNLSLFIQKVLSNQSKHARNQILIEIIQVLQLEYQIIQLSLTADETKKNEPTLRSNVRTPEKRIPRNAGGSFRHSYLSTFYNNPEGDQSRIINHKMPSFYQKKQASYKKALRQEVLQGFNKQLYQQPDLSLLGTPEKLKQKIAQRDDLYTFQKSINETLSKTRKFRQLLNKQLMKERQRQMTMEFNSEEEFGDEDEIMEEYLSEMM